MLVFEGFFVGVVRKSGVLTRFDLSSWLAISVDLRVWEILVVLCVVLLLKSGVRLLLVGLAIVAVRVRLVAAVLTMSLPAISLGFLIS